MKKINRLIKIASHVRDYLEQLQKNRHSELVDQMVNLSKGYGELVATSSKIKKALQKGWFHAAKRLQQQSCNLVNDLDYAVDKTKQVVNRPRPELAKISAIIADLQQTEQDCGELYYDPEQETLCVQTEDIHLEDLYLGAFKIELHLNKLPELHKDSPYYCIALDPQTAATSDEVTHPHVSNDRLCEGDGLAAIRAALEEGRLCDFFSIVTSILKTYNPDSPYVAIDDWSGTACHDCGYVCDSESCYYCSFCENDFCESCSSYCRLCDEVTCLGCGGSCQFCEEFVCSGCMKKCSECGCLCCESCLEETKCPNCIESESEDNNEEQENTNQQVEVSSENKETEKTTNGIGMVSRTAEACTSV